MNSFIAQIRRMYARAVRASNALQSPFLLFVRLYWGWQLSQSGWGKLHNLSKVAECFTSLNLPKPAQMAFFISCVEFFGGILLVLGLLSRLNALVLTVNMLMAYVTADREALLSFFSDPDKFAAAAPYVFLIASLIILIFGPGLFSLDTLLLRRYPCPTTT
jgi:putative oxidoreductase